MTVAAALLAVATVFFAAEADAQTTAQGLLSGKTIVIDPGHGGSDLGATYTVPEEPPYSSPYSGIQLIEKEQNLDVAYKLRKLLIDEGATVLMTREGDQNLTNTQRAEIANKAGADVLVSIHMNGSTNPDLDYTTTLFGKWRKDKEFAYAIFGGLRTLSAVNGKGTSWGTIATRDPYSYASGVLLKSNMPATIAESVFLTNDEEAKQLAAGWTGKPVEYDPNDGRQQQVAGGLKTGVVEYLDTP